MEIEATLRDLRGLAREALDGDIRVPEMHVERMAELVVALDEWMQEGRYPPSDWIRRSGFTSTDAHLYVVVVSDCDRAQADRVMNERIDHEEDYGFDYKIEVI